MQRTPTSRREIFVLFEYYKIPGWWKGSISPDVEPILGIDSTLPEKNFHPVPRSQRWNSESGPECVTSEEPFGPGLFTGFFSVRTRGKGKGSKGKKWEHQGSCPQIHGDPYRM